MHKQKVTKLDRENYIYPKVTNKESIIGHRINYNEVGALRGQRHLPSKNLGRETWCDLINAKRYF